MRFNQDLNPGGEVMWVHGSETVRSLGARM